MSNEMKAVIYKKYGGPEVLQYVDNAIKPVPKSNQLRVKIFATSVNSADWRLRKADPW